MLSADTIHELKELSVGFSILYVEDNKALRLKALKIFEKIFSHVIIASDGEEGYNQFLKYRPQIIVSDICMPKIDGLQMIKQIKHIAPSTKFIITSAFDDKKYLFQAIDMGIFHYMTKPIKIDELISSLIKCIKSISIEKNSSLFNNYMNDMLNYQSDMIALISNKKILFSNHMFLTFFAVKSIEEFENKYIDFGSLLLKHKGFLHNHDNVNWFNEAIKEKDKPLHVMITDQEDFKRHFILKMHPFPQKKNMYIMSLNDITDLHLLALFDNDKKNENNEKVKDQNTILKLMEVIQKNNAEIKIHNFYKGLTVTNNGSIVDIKDNHVSIKTSFKQEKAAQFQKNVLITSEIFPNAVLCESIEKIDFEQQIITFNKMHFLPTNPTHRKRVRVVPEAQHTVTLFIDDRKFYNDISIRDLSVEAVKLESSSLPAGLTTQTNVSVNIVLQHYNKPMIIHTPATLLRIDDMPISYFITLVLKLSPKNKKLLTEYVARRQMNLISEFKELLFDQV
jgi:YesN/AraC family two-component response regulator